MTTLKWQVGQTLLQGEREMIEATLKECGGNKSHAAEVLGTTNRTIRYKTKLYASGAPLVRQKRKSSKYRKTVKEAPKRSSILALKGRRRMPSTAA